MKKRLFIVLLLLSAILVSLSGLTQIKPRYELKNGAYDFQSAIIIDKITNEEMQKCLNDILNDNNAYREWKNLLNFKIAINKNTEYFHKKDGRYFVIDEGLAFEIVGESTLQLHLPDWSGQNSRRYDVVITLTWQPLYG